MFKKILILQLVTLCLVSSSFSSTIHQDARIVPVYQNNAVVNTSNNNNLSFGQKVKKKSSQVYAKSKAGMKNLKTKTNKTLKSAGNKSKKFMNKVKNKSHVMSENLKYKGKQTEQKINKKANEITNKIKRKMNKI